MFVRPALSRTLGRGGRIGRYAAGRIHTQRANIFTVARRATLLRLRRPLLNASFGQRNIGMLAQLGRSLLRVRYIVIGSLVGGGVTLSQTIQSWRDKLPDMGWLTDYLPDKDSFPGVERFSLALREMRDRVGQETWRLDGAKNWLNENVYNRFRSGISEVHELVDAGKAAVPAALPFLFESPSSAAEQNSLDVQLKFQREMERLEKENAELRQLLILNSGSSRGRQTQHSLIDMYSEVLDVLAEYDSSYSMQDHLPRVVVVGDQSSGKTSVLEMIAQARIFPRGSGEMMTRAPVKVTLSEGPYHLAKFKDSQREFDLTQEPELADLRREIELRMRNSVSNGKTVSKDVISLTVKGPALPRMVLIDLPGVISTVTTEMATETKHDIIDICRCHMENPNAIILCIQDGSVDAERSNVTELVSSIDPQGRRTIVVLTKVDMAEESLMNPDRVRKILEGKLFPMKALGYFAVVTGRGNRNDSIEEIRNYEESFFAKSSLFREGGLKASQLTTKNMSLAVSERFWKMVQESIEQQADSFKALRFNLETEWRNTFPKKRELDRDELFQLARNEVLDEMVKLNGISGKEWEALLNETLWKQMSAFVFDNILLPASAEKDSKGAFETKTDIRLKHWIDKTLPDRCVGVAWETLQQQLTKRFKENASLDDNSTIVMPLKAAILDKAISEHVWDKKAVDYLKMIQMNALEDRTVPDRGAWLEAVKFFEKAIRLRLEEVERRKAEMLGPGWSKRLLKWNNLEESQAKRQIIADELKSLFKTRQLRKPFLDKDEMTVVSRNVLERRSDISADEIRDVWHHMYSEYFLKANLSTAKECSDLFLHYQNGFLDVDCGAVVLFWRLQRMLHATSAALRQQIANREAKRLEDEIKKVLLEWSHQTAIKKELLVGRQVELAEELGQVRLIQEKLEDFITALNKSDGSER